MVNLTYIWNVFSVAEIEFFCVETAYLVSVRLKKLCENHCEDLALNLVTNFLKCKRQAVIQNFNLNATETQLWFIFDIYIALLYKFQDKSKILEQVTSAFNLKAKGVMGLYFCFSLRSCSWMKASNLSRGLLRNV